MPLDWTPLEREPMAKDVVLAAGGSYVVSEQNLARTVEVLADVPDVALFSSHWETCSGAARHRDGGVNPNQETML